MRVSLKYFANIYAGVAELADALDLGSSGQPWGFKSLHPHQIGGQKSGTGMPEFRRKDMRHSQTGPACRHTDIRHLKCGSGSVVEHRLAKARVAGSNPVFRSIVGS